MKTPERTGSSFSQKASSVINGLNGRAVEGLADRSVGPEDRDPTGVKRADADAGRR
jgi:hypothetical protein